MKSKLWIPIAVFVAFTTLALGGLGVKLVTDERQLLRTQFMELHAARLRDYRNQINVALQNLGSELKDRTTSCLSNDWLLHKSTKCQDSFIKEIWVYSIKQNNTGASRREEHEQLVNRFVNSSQKDHLIDTHFSNSGLAINFAHYIDPSNTVVAVATLSKIRFFAFLVSAMPHGAEVNRMIPGTEIQLIDEHGRSIYSLGNATEDVLESAILPLDSPFQTIHLKYLAPRSLWDRPFYSSALFLVLPGILLFIATFVVIFTYLYREYNRELRETEQRVTFVNQISHELKTPLTNIRMYAELLSQTSNADTVSSKRHLAIIVSESQRLSRLISSILSFSLVEKNKLEATYKPGDLATSIASLLQQFLPRFKESGFDISLDVKKIQGKKLYFDEDFLKQILGNLLSNVEKYAASGKFISIYAEQENDFSKITVEDHGSGIPEESQQLIFEPFYRCSNANNDQASGTGLGLHISRELAQLHGGNLELASSSLGTKFVLLIRTNHQNDKLNS